MYTDEIICGELKRIGDYLQRILAAIEARPTETIHTVIQPPSPTIDKDQYVNEKKAADITGLTTGWFQKKRVSGGGPPYIKVGASVRYKVGDLLAWLELNKVRHTAEWLARRQQGRTPIEF